MIPRSLLSLLLVVAATMSVAATDLLYMKDFTIQPGGTAQVEILLDNEEQYTAFQTDLYLPEGLTLDLQSVALTGRKSSDHTLATSVLVNGAVRVMSYSLQLQPYSGTSGALLTFRVLASEDMPLPATFVLKNTRLTKVSGEKIALADGGCTVSNIKIGDVNLDGSVSVADVTALIAKVLNGSALTDYMAYADVNADGIVNIGDVTALIGKVLRGDVN